MEESDDERVEHPDRREAGGRAMSAAKKKRPGLVWGIVALVVVVAIVAFLALRGSGGTATTQYTFAPATETSMTVTVSASGSAIAGVSSDVAPSVSGTVQNLSVAIGSTVSPGQVLFTIDAPDQDAAVKRAYASYKSSQQQYKNAVAQRTAAQQAEEAAEHPVSSSPTSPPPPVDANKVKLLEQQLAAACAGVTAANANLSSALLAYSQAQDTANQRTVTAPIGGVVTDLNVTEGGSTSGSAASRATGGTGSSTSTSGSSGTSSSSAVVISNLSTMKARVAVNEVDLKNVKVGQKANVSFDAVTDLKMTGKVETIAPVGVSTNNVVTYDVDISFDSQDPRIKPLMTCTADITTTDIPSALTVPNAAIKTNAGSDYVEMLDSQGNVTQVPVKIGAANDTSTQILSGLKAGDQVITGTSTSTTTSTGGGGGLFSIFRGGGGGGGGNTRGGGTTGSTTRSGG
jgi:multidrug efflux pump subunit AcrA (membrane-fusion protein)